MTASPIKHSIREKVARSGLVLSIVLAVLSEAIASTALSLGRGDIIGDTYATPDEFAWLDIGYTVPKLIAFLIAPWFTSRLNPRSMIIGTTLAMGAACGIAAMISRLELLVLLRAIQGFSGGLLLVGGQAVIFLAFARSKQPIMQAIFAIGAVVAPATITPALEGFLLDSQSWAWIFLSIVPVTVAAVGLSLMSNAPLRTNDRPRPFDWVGLCLISTALFCAYYVFSQGSRWDWFEQPRIQWMTAIGVATLLTFICQQAMRKGDGLVDFDVFRSNDFCFAFVVSFVAGAALFGSAYLIASFAVAVLIFTPTAAGQLLLPSSALFVVTLLLAAYLVQICNVPPIATVPFGIVTTMLAMWFLSGSTSESGYDDMMPAMMLRGLGLGFLFLSITLVAFGRLADCHLAFAIGLFNTGRVLGGLIGVAALQTFIEHRVAANFADLAGHLTTGAAIVSERLATTTAIMTARGLDPAIAARVATSLIGRTVTVQSTVIAFDAAFISVALLFVFAAPALLSIKLGLSRYANKRLPPSPVSYVIAGTERNGRSE